MAKKCEKRHLNFRLQQSRKKPESAACTVPLAPLIDPGCRRPHSSSSRSVSKTENRYLLSGAASLGYWCEERDYITAVATLRLPPQHIRRALRERMEAFVRLHQPANLPSQQADASPAPAVQRQPRLVLLDPAWPHWTIAHSNAEENF